MSFVERLVTVLLSAFSPYRMSIANGSAVACGSSVVGSGVVLGLKKNIEKGVLTNFT